MLEYLERQGLEDEGILRVPGSAHRLRVSGTSCELILLCAITQSTLAVRNAPGSISSLEGSLEENSAFCIRTLVFCY